MSKPIDITGLDRAQVLAALFNRSKPQGVGLLMPGSDHRMSVDTARDILKQYTGYFDYVAGRVMKIDLGGDTIDPRLYDRDNGAGAAAQAIAELRS